MRFCTLQRNAAAQIARRLALGAALLSATIVSSFAQTPRTFTPTDEAPEDYPAANGREETFYACTACHGFKLVAQQGINAFYGSKDARDAAVATGMTDGMEQSYQLLDALVSERV